MLITAAVTRAPHAPQSIEQIEIGEPRSNEILVRVVATGICHTDIAMRGHDLQFVRRLRIVRGERRHVLS